MDPLKMIFVEEFHGEQGRPGKSWELYVMNLSGGFLKWGYPQIIHFKWDFPQKLYKNHPFWGTPIYGIPHVSFLGDMGHLVEAGKLEDSTYLP